MDLVDQIYTAVVNATTIQALEVVLSLLGLLVAFLSLNEPWKARNFLLRPPGSALLSLAEFFLSKRVYEYVVAELVSNMREEYNEDLSQNRIWKARWVRVRGTWSFFAAIGLYRASAFVSFFVKAWKSVN